jgi:DNA-binding transcriptional LysR family regulator
MQVRQLEDGLGVRLLERAGPACGRPRRQSVARARRARAGRADASVERLHALRGVVAGPVRLGTGTAISMYVLPPLLRTLRARSPSVDLIVTTGTAPDVIRAVAERTSTSAWSACRSGGRELVVAPFVTDEFVAIAAPGTGAAGRPSTPSHCRTSG